MSTRLNMNDRAHDAHAKVFLRHLSDIERREGLRPHEAMKQWLELAFRALRGRLLFGDAFQQNEDAYLKLVHGYRDPSATMADMSALLSVSAVALSDAPVDFVGPIYCEVAASNSLGQFFTPHHVSTAMASMILADASSMLEGCGRPFLLCHEPACGVGGMVLAANEVLRAQGIDCARQVHWVMVDVDFMAMCGAYVQCSLTNASATVIHGNTLTLAEWMTSVTTAAAMFPKRATAAGSPPNSDTPSSTPPVPAGGQIAFQF